MTHKKLLRPCGVPSCKIEGHFAPLQSELAFRRLIDSPGDGWGYLHVSPAGPPTGLPRMALCPCLCRRPGGCCHRREDGPPEATDRNLPESLRGSVMWVSPAGLRTADLARRIHHAVIRGAVRRLRGLRRGQALPQGVLRAGRGRGRLQRRGGQRRGRYRPRARRGRRARALARRGRPAPQHRHDGREAREGRRHRGRLPARNRRQQGVVAVPGRREDRREGRRGDRADGHGRAAGAQAGSRGGDARFSRR